MELEDCLPWAASWTATTASVITAGTRGVTPTGGCEINSAETCGRRTSWGTRHRRW